MLAVELSTGNVHKLVDGLYFANGVEISSDRKYLLVSECTNYRINKINLADIRAALKTGSFSNVKKELFAEVLVGEPDNIRVHGSHLFVGVAIARTLGSPPSDLTAKWPMLRKAVSRLVYLTSIPLRFVQQSLFKHPVFEEVVFKLRSGHIFYGGLPTAGAVVVLDATTGRLKAVLGSEQFNAVSEAILDEATGDLYFGSFKNRFLGKLEAKYVKEALG